MQWKNISDHLGTQQKYVSKKTEESQNGLG